MASKAIDEHGRRRCPSTPSFLLHMIGQRVAALVPVYLPGPAPLVQRQPGCKPVPIPGMAVSPAGQSHSHQVIWLDLRPFLCNTQKLARDHSCYVDVPRCCCCVDLYCKDIRVKGGLVGENLHRRQAGDTSQTANDGSCTTSPQHLSSDMNCGKKNPG